MAEAIAHDMSRFWRIFTVQHGRVNGTFTVRADNHGRVGSVSPEDVVLYADDAHSWGRALYGQDLTAFVREDGSIDIPLHRVRENVRYEVEDAEADLLEAIRACVAAFPEPAGPVPTSAESPRPGSGVVYCECFGGVGRDICPIHRSAERGSDDA